MVVLQFGDDDEHDAADICDYIRSLVDKIECAFTNGDIIGAAGSHTAVLLQDLGVDGVVLARECGLDAAALDTALSAAEKESLLPRSQSWCAMTPSTTTTTGAPFL